MQSLIGDVYHCMDMQYCVFRTRKFISSYYCCAARYIYIYIYMFILVSRSHGHVTRCVWYCVTTSLASRARLRGITKLISQGSLSVVVEHWTSNGGVEGSILAVGKCFFLLFCI